MPADRFWEFENDTVRFGAGSVGRTDLAHLLLDEFALSYGNDWYTIPLRSARRLGVFGVVDRGA